MVSHINNDNNHHSPKYLSFAPITPAVQNRECKMPFTKTYLPNPPPSQSHLSCSLSLSLSTSASLVRLLALLALSLLCPGPSSHLILFDLLSMSLSSFQCSSLASRSSIVFTLRDKVSKLRRETNEAEDDRDRCRGL